MQEKRTPVFQNEDGSWGHVTQTVNPLICTIEYKCHSSFPSKEEAEAYACAKELADTMEKVQADKKFQMIGPADAAVARVNDIYKKVLYFKHPDYGVLIQIKDKVEQLMEEKQGVRNVSVQFDFDPVNGF